MIPTGRKIRSQVEDEKIAKQEEQGKRERENELKLEIERIQSEKKSIHQRISDFSKQVDAKKVELDTKKNEFDAKKVELDELASELNSVTSEFEKLQKGKDEVEEELRKISDEERRFKEELRSINGTKAIPKTVRRIRPQLADEDGYLETPTQRVPHSSIKIIPANSVVNVLNVGDTVRYNYTDWKVFEKGEETVYIIPVIPLGNLKLGGGNGVKTYRKSVKDYFTAVEQIEAECKKHTNTELGITAGDIRSLTRKDIDRVGIYFTLERTHKRYAYYLYSAILPTVDPEYNENKYPKVRHTLSSNNGIKSPRFYTYDYAVHTAVDEQGYIYAYPEGNDPVFVTEKGCGYELKMTPHKDDCNITVSSLLGGDRSWLASPSVYVTNWDGVDFGVQTICNDGVEGFFLFNSDGHSYTPAFGVRPLVALKSELKATKENGEWLLSK